jgi:tetratricopeptide (TPR) repeat protein
MTSLETLFTFERYDELLWICLSRIQADPDDAEALFYKAKTLVQLHQYETPFEKVIIETFKQAITQDPKNKTYLTAYALFLRSLSHKKQAAAQLIKKALVHYPDYEPFLVLEAREMVHNLDNEPFLVLQAQINGQGPDSEVFYQKIAKTHPDSIPALLFLTL